MLWLSFFRLSFRQDSSSSTDMNILALLSPWELSVVRGEAQEKLVRLSMESSYRREVAFKDYFNIIQYSPYRTKREITPYHANTYYDAGLLITLTCNKTNKTLSF